MFWVIWSKFLTKSLKVLLMSLSLLWFGVFCFSRNRYTSSSSVKYWFIRCNTVLVLCFKYKIITNVNSSSKTEKGNNLQRRIQNPVKHLKWSVLQKKLRDFWQVFEYASDLYGHCERMSNSELCVSKRKTGRTNI